jgi:general secretion pathway protein G
MELMIVLVIAGLLSTLAIPTYSRYVQRAKVTAAIGDIAEFELAIEQFRLRNSDRIPLTLEEIGIDVPLDPWGRPYEFLNIRVAGPGNSKLRKDGKLNPLNSDFDLYSKGADGDSKSPLSAPASRDDVIRASNGAFIGLGVDY